MIGRNPSSTDQVKANLKERIVKETLGRRGDERVRSRGRLY